MPESSRGRSSRGSRGGKNSADRAREEATKAMTAGGRRISTAMTMEGRHSIAR